ncbi:site-specific DNA-methyltransferase [Dermabacteraceae bacterium P7006]
MSRKPQRLELTWYNKDMALIPTEEGKYGYTWVDPSDPRYCETHTLVMDEYIEGQQAPKEEGRTYSERADLEPTTDNLLIHGESGDVLEALTRVPELAEKYVGKVKLTYIDPPFNTAQTFASYEDNLEHSVWLTMMRDRLLHMKKLLRPDGSIWVHLDMAELHRMRLLLDEVFGSANFVAEIAWRKTYSPENRSIITQSHDIILVFAKNIEQFTKSRHLMPRTAAQNAAYKNPDNDPRGPWKPGDFTAQAGHGTAKQFYTLVTPAGNRFDPPPGRCWVYTEARYQELLADNRVFFGRDGQGRPNIKRFLSEVVQGRVPDSWWDYTEVGHSQDAKREIQALFPGVTPFSTPKPERLLERVIHIGSNPGDIVLDVFAGSGTTAAVVHKMGRRWVTCELLEDTYNRFTKARLTKVVKGEDPGGITTSSAERVAAEGVDLPEGVSPEDAQKLTSLLNKVLKDNEELKKDKTIKQVKALVKTVKTPEVINWRGGGGFQVAHLGPQCFDYSESLGHVILTDAATGEALVESVVANLGFELLHPEDDYVFDGRKGRTLLKVHEGVADTNLVDDLVAHLGEGELLVLAATGVEDGVRQYLRRARKGSRIVHVPDDVFRYNGQGEE